MGILNKIFGKTKDESKNKKRKPSVLKFTDKKTGATICFTEYGDSTDVDIYKGDKEIFSGEIIGSNQKYWIASGYKGDNESLAFGDKNGVIKYKTHDDSVEACVMYNGSAIVFGYENVVVISEDKTSTRTFEFGDCFDESRLLTSECAAFIDESDEPLLKCFVFETLKPWSKKLKMPNISDESKIFDGYSLSLSPDGRHIVVTVCGVNYNYTIDGELIQ